MKIPPTESPIFSKELPRGTYLGGGDAPTVLGVNPYETRLDLYQRLTGQTESKAINYRMSRGALVEAAMRQWYLSNFPKTNFTAQGFIQHPEHEFLGGHPDLVLHLDGNTIKLVEFKDTTLRHEWGTPQTSEIPERVAAQVLAYAELIHERCRGSDWKLDPTIDVVVDLGGSEPELFHAYRQDDHGPWILRELVDFWVKHVKAKVPPTPGNPAQCLAAWPSAEPRVVAQASMEAEFLISQIAGLSTDIADLTEKKRALVRKVMIEMAEAELLVNPTTGKTLASWKNVNYTTLNQDKLKEQFAEVYEACREIKQTRRFLPKKVITDSES